jgi:hypothetical protein
MAIGDRVEVERRIAGSTVTYLHHGIDVGDGTVVHARPDDFRRPFAGGRVVRTSLAEFAAGVGVRTATEPPPTFPPEEIVARALGHVGRAGYCPVVDNCEHFATWCATGRRASRQVDIVVARVAAAAARTIAAVSARAAAGAAERGAVRAALGSSVGLGLQALVPAVIAGEASALVAEWRAHQAGWSSAGSRRAGDAAGLATTAVVATAWAAAAGPAAAVAGGLCGAAAWAVGHLARRHGPGRAGGAARESPGVVGIDRRW